VQIMTALAYPHIEIGKDGVPMLSGTRTKIVEVVLDHLAHDWDAREIHRQHPHLTMGQIHAALTYYYDHQAEIDDDIQRRAEKVEAIRSRIGESSLRARLKRPSPQP
jgi:uncharacterized protein (DUF433 family)